MAQMWMCNFFTLLFFCKLGYNLEIFAKIVQNGNENMDSKIFQRIHENHHLTFSDKGYVTYNPLPNHSNNDFKKNASFIIPVLNTEDTTGYHMIAEKLNKDVLRNLYNSINTRNTYDNSSGAMQGYTVSWIDAYLLNKVAVLSYVMDEKHIYCQTLHLSEGPQGMRKLPLDTESNRFSTTKFVLLRGIESYKPTLEGRDKGSSRKRRQLNQSPESKTTASMIVPLVPDVNECQNDGIICAINAECINKWPGYHCKCLPGHIGNGKYCIRYSDNSFVSSVGKLSGWIGSSRINNADISMLFSKGRSFVSISPVEGVSGKTLSLIPEIIGFMSWLFSLTKSTADVKGFDVTGPYVSCKTTITFETGEVLFINQILLGQNSAGYFRLDTKIHGRSPVIRNNARIIYSNHKEEFIHQRFGHFVSDSDLQFHADGKLYKYKINRMIQFEEYTGQTIPDKMFLEFSKKRTVFNPQRKLLRFQYSTILQTMSEVTPPCTTREQLTCPLYSHCLVLKSSPLGFICMCKNGQDKFTKSCLAQTDSIIARPTSFTPAKRQTSPYYKKTTEVENVVTSKKLYPTLHKTTAMKEEKNYRPTESIGSFIIDPPIPTEDLNTKQPTTTYNEDIVNTPKFDKTKGKRVICNGRFCDRNAECQDIKNVELCVCKSGYFGNGTICERNKPCDCHQRASCFRNGQGDAACYCNPGYEGDGKYCQDINECNRDFKACGKNMKCFNLPGSYTCKCQNGYQSKRSSCVDIKECSSEVSPCGKNSDCIEYDGSYQCKCKKGFVKTRNKRDCIAVCPRCLNGGLCLPDNICKCQLGYFGKMCQWVGNEFLVFTQGRNLKRLSLPYVKMGYGNIARSHYDGILVGVDYDCRNQRAYFTDISNGRISAANLDGSQQKLIVSDLVYPEGITVDWLGENIFWTDSGLDRIEISKLDGRHRTVIINKGLLNPRAIVCDPFEGLIFWTDWVRGKAKIEVASMNGCNRHVLVDSELILPNGLTIDHGNKELCWTDAGRSTISCIEYNGQRRRTLYNEAHYPFSLSIHNGILYWTDWKSGMIERIKKSTGEKLTALSSGMGSDGRLYDIKSVKPCPNRESLCSILNGGCNKICVQVSKTERRCLDSSSMRDSC